MRMCLGELVIIVLIVAVVFLGLFMPSASCENKAAAMGMNSKWGWTTDCMIETEPGKWVPLKNYRVM